LALSISEIPKNSDEDLEKNNGLVQQLEEALKGDDGGETTSRLASRGYFFLTSRAKKCSSCSLSD